MTGKSFFTNGVVVCSLVAISTAAAGKVIYVDANAPGINDGAKWHDAYTFLQDALADADSSEKPVYIKAARGIYTPDCNSAVAPGTGDRSATFQLLNGVTLFGDFDRQQDVDFADYSILATHWLEDYSRVDIGGAPGGDGVIDHRDLAVLANHWLGNIAP